MRASLMTSVVLVLLHHIKSGCYFSWPAFDAGCYYQFWVSVFHTGPRRL